MLNLLTQILGNYFVRAVILLALSACLAVLLVSYNNHDPSWNVESNYAATNWFFGRTGSVVADFLYQLFGIGAVIIPFTLIFWSISLLRNGRIGFIFIKCCALLLSFATFGVLCSSLPLSFLPSTPGGALGIVTIDSLKIHLDGAVLFFAAAIIFPVSLLIALGVDLSILLHFWGKIQSYEERAENISIDDKLNKLAPKVGFSGFFGLFKRSDNDQNSGGNESYSGFNPSSSYPANGMDSSIPTTQEDQPEIVDSYQTKTSSKVLEVGQAATASDHTLPALNLLDQAHNQNIKPLTLAELSEQAEALIQVLDDFGVRGKIIDIRQGPVVTLYEFEPSAGTKSSRVIGLADDIARSLSAVSTRISVVPGRNALGIELPNRQRMFFRLRELIETQEYNDSSTLLPLILGKDLGGSPYIADLAKMPHLLVAGTTGSGKSVAINTMIMSLLYRYTPDECRFIMIDPKMLELSAYDNIPHLLTPVVTEPGKAVTALKWAVKEMENRYRLMSNLGVRNIANYNAKIQDSLKDGKSLERKIQTGFDPETGKPIYESVPLDMSKMPFIVVIVDEMADLMLVAGKDIESSIQRLAQMARAAGIHIVMATQRPSVDVITGVIKANFPSRISFKVISKFDSRTILGEQGSEQLLGMGDMLYMGNSAKIIRIHGPFVDDKEVERVTDFLRSTGVPEYVGAVTESEEGGDLDDLVDANSGGDEESLYRQAVQIVKTERKTSISYIQRCLRVGYNRAAILVEKMEKNGIVSVPNHTGKREVLLPEE